jgi:hypothetical protein
LRVTYGAAERRHDSRQQQASRYFHDYLWASAVINIAESAINNRPAFMNTNGQFVSNVIERNNLCLQLVFANG